MGFKVVVAMSGGVDSSVAAALLQREGHEVIGMMMRLWSQPGRERFIRCCTPEAMSIARQVAGQLGIPFYAVNAQDAFRDIVVEYFLDGYASGVTPNPCLACNRHIRWEFLLERALALGAEYMATGHYVRLLRDEGQPARLFEAADKEKDQSYILSVLRPDQLKYALFPLGELTKVEVRKIATELKLPAAQSKESQDLCFLGGEDYRDFLHRHAPELGEPGPILNREGERLGEHSGLIDYTIGQRKGLGISAPEPLYVLDKDREQNALIVGTREELGHTELTASQMNWTQGVAPEGTFEASVKIRYKAAKAAARVTPLDGERIRVEFEEPQPSITPGQAAVVYRSEELLGGGIIQANGEEREQAEPQLAEALA